MSMGTIAARQAAEIVANARQVLAIELLCAAQGVDFRAPYAPGRGTEAAYRRIRSVVPFMDKDRILYTDIEAVARLVPEDLIRSVEAAVGTLE